MATSYFMDTDDNIEIVPSHLDAIQDNPNKYGLTAVDVQLGSGVSDTDIVDKALQNGFVRLFGGGNDWNITINGMWSKAYYVALHAALQFDLSDDTVFYMTNNADGKTRTKTLDQIKTATDSGTIASLKVAMARLKHRIGLGDSVANLLRMEGSPKTRIASVLSKFNV